MLTMPLSLRDRIACAAAWVLLLASVAVAADTWTRDDAAHLLRRAGFGGTPAQVDALHALGRDAAVDYLLDQSLPAGAQAPFPQTDLAEFVTKPIPAGQEGAKVRREEVVRLRNWWLERMIRTGRPLEEKMALFWHGLFTSGIMEVREPDFMARQCRLFHDQAMGNYRSLTAAICRDPAMLRYLNADQNVRGKPNENLARELLELFTMGEGNGYTERDIAEVARALTGLGVGPQGFVFRPMRHDAGEKTIFGKTGRFNADGVVKLIFDRPEPAEYLARRLWQYFGCPQPAPADIALVAEALRKNDWELRPALRVLFTSDAFYRPEARFSLVKSPVELFVQTMRLLEIRPEPPLLTAASTQGLRAMGQELFQPPNVRGWPGGELWITTSTLYIRYNSMSGIVFAAPRAGPATRPQRPVGPDMAALFELLGRAPTPRAVVDAAVDRLLQRPLPADKRQALLGALGDAPIRLGTSDADRRLRQLVSLVVSTPEYQMQ